MAVAAGRTVGSSSAKLGSKWLAYDRDERGRVAIPRSEVLSFFEVPVFILEFAGVYGSFLSVSELLRVADELSQGYSNVQAVELMRRWGGLVDELERYFLLSSGGGRSNPDLPSRDPEGLWDIAEMYEKWVNAGTDVEKRSLDAQLILSGKRTEGRFLSLLCTAVWGRPATNVRTHLIKSQGLNETDSPLDAMPVNLAQRVTSALDRCAKEVLVISAGHSTVRPLPILTSQLGADSTLVVSLRSWCSL